MDARKVSLPIASKSSREVDSLAEVTIFINDRDMSNKLFITPITDSLIEKLYGHDAIHRMQALY